MPFLKRPDSGSVPTTPTGTVEEQAAAWRDLLHDPQVSTAQREDFSRWREQSPKHAEAYARIDRGWAFAEALAKSPEMLTMEKEVLARIALRAGHGQQRFGRHRWMALAAGLLILIVGGLVATGGSPDELRWLADRTRHALVGETLYRTTVGERLAVSLSDGSTITLNTRSRAAVRYHDGIRSVTLLDGQALFDVAHDAQRPFIVTAGNRRVTALGTLFDVRLSEQQLEVTLIQGRVSVEAEAATPASRLRTELAPGEQFVAALAAQEPRTTAAFPEVRPANVERAISWRNGQVHFDGDPLRDVIREINRYSERQFVLADERLGTLRISGAFNTGNTAAFIDMLTGSYLPVRIVEADRAHIVLGYRSP
jgi:transmembrane sensor